jgi:hypothetical protein
VIYARVPERKPNSERSPSIFAFRARPNDPPVRPGPVSRCVETGRLNDRAYVGGLLDVVGVPARERARVR